MVAVQHADIHDIQWMVVNESACWKFKDRITFSLSNFGPVQTIIKFSTMDEVLDRANNTTYGLAAGVITKDINTAMMCVQGLEAGSVWYV
jgi:acyl-CoA reductase-like NAD-dependent aldehyde dehydrogenase